MCQTQKTPKSGRPATDFTNKRIGPWLVLRKATPEDRTERSLPEKGKLLWLCECQHCGHRQLLTPHSLKICWKKDKCRCVSVYARELLPGKKFGALTVKDVHDVTAAGLYRWNCNCDCGEESVVSTTDLVRGRITSCGCVRKANSRARMRRRNKQMWDLWRQAKEAGTL